MVNKKDTRSKEQKRQDNWYNKQLFLTKEQIAEHDKYLNSLIPPLDARHPRPLEQARGFHPNEFDQEFQKARFQLWLEKEHPDRLPNWNNYGIAINDDPNLASEFKFHAQPRKNKGGAHRHRARKGRRGVGRGEVRFGKDGFRIYRTVARTTTRQSVSKKRD